MRGKGSLAEAMTNEQLCALALQAIDDTDARLVLDDARIEGCLDELEVRHSWLTEDEWPRAIAAEILFRDWPTSWPLVDRLARRLPDVTFTVQMPVHGIRVEGRITR